MIKIKIGSIRRPRRRRDECAVRRAARRPTTRLASQSKKAAIVKLLYLVPTLKSVKYCDTRILAVLHPEKWTIDKILATRANGRLLRGEVRQKVATGRRSSLASQCCGDGGGGKRDVRRADRRHGGKLRC